ncbi:MAG: rRNA maturation RNase YbeY [Sphingobacteriales bacterium]|jgi:rRNA maturation RNase YbeY|nr:MAG: rRNA maturation RNase YbeY [Sphingobacteriales bacterium]
MHVSFYFDEVAKPKYFKSISIKKWFKTLEQHYHQKIDSLQYIFLSDEQLLEINMQFLQHDTYTDIITFNLAEHATSINGEIYISIDRIVENAIKFNASEMDELLRVMAHGFLHLIGYNDKKKADKSLMTEQENICVQLYHSLR